MKVYVVMRENGIRSDGYYYESDTHIIGGREKKEDAIDLLQQAAKMLHPNEKPIRGTFDQYGNTQLVFDNGADDLEDKFWIYELVTSKIGDCLL